MTDIDLDALQATNGIQIPLIDGAVRVRSTTVTGPSKQGFAAISAVALRVSVPMLRGEGGPSVTVTVQKSSNGSAWSTAHAFVFTGSGDAEFVLDDPLDYLRVVCTPGGGLREAVVASVFAVPQFVDPPAAEGSLPSPTSEGDVLTVVSGEWAGAAPSGGSQPGASRWLGPCKINCFSGQLINLAAGFDVDGGTYTLTVNGQTTAATAWDAEPADVVLALNALSSINGKAALDPLAGDQSGNTINSGIAIIFNEGAATEIVALDASSLTGISAPYADGTATSSAFLLELLTPDVSDIVEDFLHAVVTPFDQDALLVYTDDISDPTASSPIWSNPGAWAGVNGLDLTGGTDYTNFRGSGSAGATVKPTALQAMLSAPIEAGGTDVYSNLPAVVINSVPIYSYISMSGAPTQGEVWIYAQVSTPAPDMD